jgi:hemolysin activation/secretion protein
MLSPVFSAVRRPFLVAASMLILSSAATLSGQVPTTLEPIRADQNLKPAPQPKSVPRPEVKLNNRQLAPKDAAMLTFTFKELIFQGNAALSSAELAFLWPHKSGDQVTIEAVFALANAVTKRYADAGYALCFGVVPEQDIKDGKVRVVVVEGFLSEHAYGVARPSGRALNATEAQLGRLRASRPLRTDVLERNVLLMDDLPGWDVGSVLSASPTVVGGSDLSLEFTRVPDAVDLSWNNFLPRALDRQVAGATWSGYGHLDGADELSLGFYRSPEGDAYRSFNVAASTLIGSDGERIGFTFSQSDSRPTDPLLVPLEFKGRSRNARVTLSKPLIRSRAATLQAEAYVGSMDADSSLIGGAPTRDALRIVGGTLTYDFARQDQSTNLVRLNLEQGLAGLGAEGNSRANGSSDYTVASLDFTRSAPLAALGAAALSYSFALQGQCSLGDPLLSPVEAAFGGRQFGRFFDAGSMNGEQALFGSFELRYARPLALGLAEPVRFQGYLFFDAGMIRQQGELQPQELRERHAASAGLGVRLGLPHGMNALVEITRLVSQPAGVVLDDSPRVNASFGVRF